MKHLFVPYNLALELKSKGFDGPCFYVYNINAKELFSSNCNDLKNQPKNSELNISITAPLHQQVIDWLREKYNINIITPTQLMYSNEWICRAIQLQSKNELEIGGGCKDYYEALNKAIEEVLKLI